jgi:hypothetical protein
VRGRGKIFLSTTSSVSSLHSLCKTAITIRKGTKKGTLYHCGCRRLSHRNHNTYCTGPDTDAPPRPDVYYPDISARKRNLCGSCIRIPHCATFRHPDLSNIGFSDGGLWSLVLHVGTTAISTQAPWERGGPTCQAQEGRQDRASVLSVAAAAGKH